MVIHTPAAAAAAAAATAAAAAAAAAEQKKPFSGVCVLFLLSYSFFVCFILSNLQI